MPCSMFYMKAKALREENRLEQKVVYEQLDEGEGLGENEKKSTARTLSEMKEEMSGTK